jgi:hypothetical protein
MGAGRGQPRRTKITSNSITAKRTNEQTLARQLTKSPSEAAQILLQEVIETPLLISDDGDDLPLPAIADLIRAKV